MLSTVQACHVPHLKIILLPVLRSGTYQSYPISVILMLISDKP